MEWISAGEFEGLTSFIRGQYGINLSNNKAFAHLRIRRLMDKHGYSSFQEYYHFLRQDASGEAMSDFISNLTISYSLFNRDPSHFTFLEQEILPGIEKRERHTRDLRIWSAGCATGEEPYTIAMVVQDYFGPGSHGWNTGILASDISSQALKRASEGVYPVESIRGLNPSWQERYFTRLPHAPGSVQVADRIRQDVLLKRINLVGPLVAFKQKFHCIFCRNVMLYFDDRTKKEVLQRLGSVLEQGGYLFIGTTETIDRKHSSFRYVQPSIYRKE
ncbi:protein-glutamate O-methyltransferase CheR [Eubacteriales bacterium OttesenSCG-928-A19]|nr:protein-glutamate O-methyltransferase CheR [Eubacteriales bacterium OttesenSCG-928-A19]